MSTGRVEWRDSTAKAGNKFMGENLGRVRLTGQLSLEAGPTRHLKSIVRFPYHYRSSLTSAELCSPPEIPVSFLEFCVL